MPDVKNRAARRDLVALLVISELLEARDLASLAIATKKLAVHKYKMAEIERRMSSREHSLGSTMDWPGAENAWIAHQRGRLSMLAAKKVSAEATVESLRTAARKSVGRCDILRQLNHGCGR